MKIINKGRVLQWFGIFLIVGFLAQPFHRAIAAEEVVSQPAEQSVNVDSVEQSPDSKATEENLLSESEEVTGPKSEPSENSEEPEQETQEETQEKIEEEEEASDNGIPEPPVVPNIQLPPTTVKQKVADADIASGALVYEYSMQTPNGRSGAQPSLGLSYNSQQNEEGSLVGYGWSVNLPSIERKNVDGLQNLYTSKNFTSSLDGDLKFVSASAGTDKFGAKIDNGAFLRYEFADQSNGGVWTVTDKKGTKYTFGAVAESRLSNPVDATKVFRWHLTKVEDLNGNFVSYTYSKVDNQVYPNEILYTGHGSNDGIYKIKFNLEDRPDKAMSAKYGFMVTNTKRLANVEVLVQNVVIGKYNFTYSANSVNGRTQFTGVEFTGYDIAGQNGISDGGTSFEYGSIASTNLLTKIKQNTGGETVVTYKSSAQYRGSGGESLNPNLPFALQTVEEIEYNDGNGVIWHNEFEYSGGWFYYNGPMDRRFVGFEKVVRTDSVGNRQTTFYHQGNDNNTVYGELADDWSKAGKVYKSELRDSQGNLFAQVINKWESASMAGTRAFTKLTSTINRTYDGNSSHRDAASTYTYDNATGNVLTGVDYGEVTALTDNGTFTDIGTDKVTSTATYAVGSGANPVTGFVSGFIDKNQSNVKIKESKSYYDDLPFGQVGIGNVTKEENWIEGSTYAEINRTYNSFGLPETESDPLGNITTYAYDSFDLYPITVSNALSQVTTFEYDYRLGKPQKTVDANGLVAKVTTDSLGRVVKEEFTDPSQSDPEILFTKKTASYELYQQSGVVEGWKTTETNYLDETNSTSPRTSSAITYTDGFDRPIQIRGRVESASGSSDERYVISDTVYNNIGQIAKTSLPYFGVGSARTAASTDNSLFTTLAYDSASRVISTTNSVGLSTNVYDDWKVTTTDANGKVKGLFKDAFGRLVKVEEHNGSEVYETKYDYDGSGNLVKITDALDNEREFEYDGLGRRTRAEDLHAPNDNTFGVWSYEYDLAGNLNTRTDGNGQAVIYTYDPLNRILSEDASNSHFRRNYEYDSCPMGIGRLCLVTSDGVNESTEYNILGQVTNQTKTISGEPYITAYTYDRQGNQVTITNPDASVVKYEYNIAGQQEKVLRKEDGDADFTDVIVNMDYAPSGAVAYLEYASGAKTTNTYAATQLYRLSNKTTTLPLTAGGVKTIQNSTYTYDPVGNITYIADTSELNTRKNITYTYDDLHRLTWANTSHAVGGQNYSQVFQYDAIGNIISKSDVGAYSYEGDQGSSYANPHAVTSVTNSSNQVTTYDYDQNGNLISQVDASDSTTYEWDHNNRMIELEKGGILPTVFSYEYDSAGIRTKAISQNKTTIYPSGFYNTDGSISEKHVLAGGMSVATIKGRGGSTTLTQLHSDHLGSVVVTSIPGTSPVNGGIAEILDYYPFGAIRTDSVSQGSAEQRKYIGKEYDVETGLNYLEARYYDGKLGRFLSQDIVHLSLGDPNAIKQITGQELQVFLSDPQNFNSYSYARNNPISLKDPNGNWFIDWITGEQSTEELIVEIGDAANTLYDTSPTWKAAMDHPIVAGVVVGVTGGVAVAGGAVVTTAVSTSYLGGAGTACIAFCGQAAQTAQKGIDYATRFGQSYGPRMNEIVRDLTDTNPNKFDDHAIMRMVQRNVDVGTVNRVMNLSKPFSYFHDGVMKNGYYDEASRVFVGQIQSSGLVKTVITNVTPNYVENLKRTMTK